MRTLLGGVALTVTLILSVGAGADQKNTFSDGGTVNVDSEATATATDNATATATSDSYNTSLEGVVSQTLIATVGATTTAVSGDGTITNGDAIVTATGRSSGLIQTGANSGVGSIVQQGIALGAAGGVDLP